MNESQKQGKCKEHPKYKAILPARIPCPGCGLYYMEVKHAKQANPGD